MAAVRLVLKFAAGQDAVLENGEFVSGRGERLSALNSWLKAHRPIDVRPVFDPATADGNTRATERALGLDRYYRLDFDGEPEEIEAQAAELSRLDFVEEAYVEGPAELAPDAG